MKIIKLKISDYLGIQSVNLTKTGKINRISGANGIGKSAILKAIQEAFKSSGNKPELIRNGAKKAEILIELTGNIDVQRTITASTNTVKVVDNGVPLDKPTAFLKKIIGPYSFNPIAFFLGSQKERRTMLLSIMPMKLYLEDIEETIGEETAELLSLHKVDFSKHGLEVLDEVKSKIYEARHEQGLSVTRLTKAIEQDRRDMPESFDVEKWESFDSAKVRKQYESALKECSDHRARESELESMRKESTILAEQIEQKKEQIKRLQAEIAEMDSRREEIIKDGRKLKDELSKVQLPDPGTYEIQLNEYESHRKLVFRLDEIKKKENELTGEKERHESLDAAYKTVANELPKKLLEESELPITGLKIEGDIITVNEVPLEQLSTSEQMIAGVNIARAVSGDLKVICLDRIESLDQDAREAFIKAATSAEDEFEYFITEVTRGDMKIEKVDAPEGTAEKVAKKPETSKSGF